MTRHTGRDVAGRDVAGRDVAGRDLTVDALTVRFGARTAVDRFAATVAAGEWLCLIGPNGAGKSSILRGITGLAGASGHVAVGGRVLGSLSPRDRARLVAYVPQAPVLPADMNGHDYVLLGRNPYVRPFRSESRHDRAVVAEVLERLDLQGLAGRPLGSMSGGERQRLVIARALAQQAPVLLLDEPTTALDIGHQQQALDLVDRLRRQDGLTVVSAMHDLTLAGLYSDRLALLHSGVVVAQGTAPDVLRPETLAEFYGVSVRVHHEVDGTVVVVPVRSGSG
jgi:iron complex transport system ATP-binding protein